MNAEKLIELIKKLIANAVSQSEKTTKESIAEQIKSLPKAEKGDKGDAGINGKDGKDGSDGKDAVIDENFWKKLNDIFSLEKLKDDVVKTLEKVDQRILEIKDGADGKDGVDGKDGLNGKDGINGKDGADGINGKDGADGINGKDAPEVNVKEIEENVLKAVSGAMEPEMSTINKFIEAIPLKLAEFEEAFKKEINSFQSTCGQTITDLEVKLKNMVEPMVKFLFDLENEANEKKLDEIVTRFAKSVGELQKALEGTNKQIQTLSDENVALKKHVETLTKGLDGKDGKDGKDGSDGRDALEIQILDVVDFEKQYPRGTFVTINGGLYKAFRATDPVTDETQPLEKSGWTCVVKGIKDISSQYDDTTNEITLTIVDSEGKSTNQTVKFSPIVYKGVWREQDAPFAKNNSITYGGGLWISLVDNNKSKPGEDKCWQLAVKKGRDGKDGSKGAKGDQGEAGKDGRNLTRIDDKGNPY